MCGADTEGTQLWPVRGQGLVTPRRRPGSRQGAGSRPSAWYLPPGSWILGSPGLGLWNGPKAAGNDRGGGVGQVNCLNGTSMGAATHLVGAGGWASGPRGSW